MENSLFLDSSLFASIFKINLSKALLLFGVAFFLFGLLPRWLFPQRYAGAGLEKSISNILYMLVFFELMVPLMIQLGIFSLFSLLAVMVGVKLLFLRLLEKQKITDLLEKSRDRALIAIFNFLDDPRGSIEKIKRDTFHAFYDFLLRQTKTLPNRLFLLALAAILLYYLGYRCFISMSNPLPDTSQFVEWVANLQKGILYAENKTAGADFYGLSIFIFVLQIFTNIDSLILFNIYPLLLIAFLLLGVYFVSKRFALSWRVAAWSVMIYGLVLVGSPLNDYLLPPFHSTTNPEIIHFLLFKFYSLPKEWIGGVTGPGFTPYLRYFSGMAYEFASAFFLLNLYYLIHALQTGRTKDLINYSLTLMLVFIFHGGGAIALSLPSILIALHALVSKKLSWTLLKRGLLAIGVAAIFGNGWILSVLKYGIPQDFGAAAPFLDRLFGTKQAMEEIVATGVEEVTVSYLSSMQLYLFSVILLFFVLARIGKKGFYFASFLLIPLGVFFLYYSENLGFFKLIYQDRAAEYLLLSLVPVVACGIKLLFYPLQRVFPKLYRILFLPLSFAALSFILLFLPHYKDSPQLMRSIDPLNYSPISWMLYTIKKEHKPYSWTVVSFIEEYPQVLGHGYFINTQEFIARYDPIESKLPSQRIFIFVEDIPHTPHLSSEWYYRWREQITDNLKAWIALYSSTHRNIRLWKKSTFVSVYEIDNTKERR